MPAAICEANPSAVSWSEVTQRGARVAIHWRACFSMRAVSERLTRIAVLNSAAGLIAAAGRAEEVGALRGASERDASGAKAHARFAGLMRGLKPPPPSGSSF